MATNTKKRHLEILAVAFEVLNDNGGVSEVDSLDQEARIPTLRGMAKEIKAKTDCHIDTAKRNLATAMRRERYNLMKSREVEEIRDILETENWGGPRPGGGRPPKES